MSRRTTFTSTIAAAVVSAAITAAALLLTSAGADEQGGANNILAFESSVVSEVRTPPAPAEPGDFFDGQLVVAVDWASIYADTVPSVVSIVVDEGSGSGFFVSEDGHVITNLHVVADAEDLVVLTYEGVRLEAELIARDVGNDLALLKVDATELDIVVPTYAPLEEVRIGDPVGALGSPFGLTNSLTVGIISGLGRLRPSGNATFEPLRNTIQTDAALNPGNSGGILVDARGRIVGIPTQIESPERVSSGVGFAVSADTLLSSLPTLLTGTDVERAYLGVLLDISEGQLSVTDVTCDSSADQAGVRAGDVILQVNGQAVVTFEQLSEALAAIAPGDDLSVTVQRGRRELTLEASAHTWPSTIPESGCG